MAIAFALAWFTCSAAERTLLEWAFDHAGDLQGWQPNGHLTQVAVANGTLTGRAAGSDPILELRPLLDLPASPWQFLEVRLKADHEGTAEFFWSNTSTGRYGGFTQEKATRFNVVGNGQWQVYRLFPFWHPERKIVRLRFDVYDGATFAVDYLRVSELTMPPPAERTEFDFTKAEGAWTPSSAAVPMDAGVGESLRAPVQGWQAMPGVSIETNRMGLGLRVDSTDGFVLSPPLRITADERSYVSLRMAVDKGAHATLYFVTEQAHGLHSLSFPVEADGREHTYNLDLLTVPGWRGRIIALGLRPSDVPGARAQVRWLKISDAPQGAPQLKVVSFALEDALPRVGLPATLSAIVANTGGETATNLRAAVTVPKGMKILGSSPAGGHLAVLGFGEEAVFQWKVECPAPLSEEAELHLTCAHGESTTARAPLAFTPRLPVPRTGYVPEPKPVRGRYEVGVYYFPGWKSASQWHPIERFPERKPVLGWYREGDPEVADWHIKWAVEHGITFFAYDWYWNQGARQLEHALHDGYFKARYRHLLKFCLLWANHNPPRTSSLEDCLAVTRYWIENYFRRPEHLTIDGKPAVIIFSPHRLTEDLGSATVKKVFDALRAECQRAGLKGLHLIACVGDAGGARRAAEEGYDAVTAYNWPGLGMTGTGNYAPFETLLAGYRRNWEHILEQSPIPLTPLPVCGGWDSRPWHGDNNLVRFGRTPELFQRHLQDAKRVLEVQSPKSKVQGLVLIEAWNEWGEGSYIEPHKEFGFGYLDPVRAVFTDAPKAHADVTPADVGLGPYDVPPPGPPQTTWDFMRGEAGWNNTMNLTEVRVEAGVLTGRTTGHDPAFFGPPTQARAREFGSVVVRMKLQRQDRQPFKDSAQLFWRTSRLPESEANSERFEVLGDGQWHEYRIPVAQNRRWRGAITRLRLDPCNQAGVSVEVRSIALKP